MPDTRNGVEHPRPLVHEGLDAKSMHFSGAEIQSRMQILQPDVLDLAYTRTMMGFLLFNGQPTRMAMIGLGGGSLVKFCRRHLPRTPLTVVEINPHVIALRDAFRVPPDDAHLQVIADDGAHFVAHTDQRFDVLMVDAFDAQGMPPTLGSQRFYSDALDVLYPGGLMVVNLHASHPHCPVYLERIRRCFGENVLQVNDADDTNCIVFARKGAPLPRAAAKALRRPATLDAEAWAQLRPAFSRIAHALNFG